MATHQYVWLCTCLFVNNTLCSAVNVKEVSLGGTAITGFAATGIGYKEGNKKGTTHEVIGESNDMEVLDGAKESLKRR